MELLLDTLIAMDVMEKCYDEIKHLSLEGFASLVGMLVDQYGADHAFTSEQTCEMLRTLCEVQEDIHSSIGMMTSTH